MTDSEQIIELQTRITHLDDTVDQLNTVVVKQQQSLIEIHTQLKRIHEEYQLIKSSVTSEITDSPPPHY